MLLRRQGQLKDFEFKDWYQPGLTCSRSNRLQVNPSKTEVLWCYSSRRQHQIPTSPVHIGSTYVLPVTSVCDLGLYIDCDVSLHTHTRHRHRQIVLRCLTADTQCSAVSPTARPAVAHPCVSRQQGRLLMLSAGRRLPSVVVSTVLTDIY